MKNAVSGTNCGSSTPVASNPSNPGTGGSGSSSNPSVPPQTTGTPGQTPGQTSGGKPITVGQSPVQTPGQNPGQSPSQTSVPSDTDVTVKFARVCSAMRSNIPYPQFVFFEEAKRPILSIEAALPADQMACDSKRSQYAAAGYYPPSYRPSPYQLPISANGDYTGGSNLTLASMSLTGVNLMSGPFQTQVAIKLDQLKASFSNWSGILVSARVCDDTNGDGKCSDKTPNYVLSVAAPSFTLNHIPQTIDIDVWNGRYFTLASDPSICEKQYSPLILDTTGQGFKLSGIESGVHFDLNANGHHLLTGWPAVNNVGFLVRPYANGVTSGRQLFGSATILSNGMLAANGFEALKDLDSNADGVFNAADKEWNSVMLWFDRNENGVVDPGELVALSDAGVQSINLNYVDVMEVDSHGNQTRERSTFRRLINGKSIPLQIIDIWFDTVDDGQ
jgi:hypothetical protein